MISHWFCVISCSYVCSSVVLDVFFVCVIVLFVREGEGAHHLDVAKHFSFSCLRCAVLSTFSTIKRKRVLRIPSFVSCV